MKALNCKPLVVALLFTFLAGSTMAQEVKKTFKKDFKTNSDTELVMETDFSDLTIETWNKNQAEFEVTISVDLKDKAKAAKILDQLNVEITKEGNTIMLESTMEDKFKKLDWGEDENKKFSIKIIAKIPADIQLELENTFGAVSMGSFSGPVSVENSFGSFHADALTGKSIDLSFNYGENTITSLNNASVKLNYGNFNVQNAQNLDIEVAIGNCEIGTVKNLSAEVSMGELNVEKVDADFGSIDIESATSTVTIGIDKNAGFKFSAEMAMGNLEYPKLDKLKKNKDGMSKEVSGTYGNGKSNVSIEGSMGSIKIKLK